MRFAAVNINFDSLAMHYNYPEGFHDVTFFEVAERFMTIADKYNFRYTIYIIGKDLEQAENRARVKQWAEQGHEIGNHSYSHHLNLGARPESEIRDEVARAHDLIAETVGYAPKGFIAPGWSTSSRLLKVLIDLGYEYDTSTFPSWLSYLSLVKMVMNNWGSGRGRMILDRRDLAAALLAPRRVYQTDGPLIRAKNNGTKHIQVMPLPTTRNRIALWHTIGFIFGWRFHDWLLGACLEQIEAFYYLTHPLDLMDSRDLDTRYKSYEERIEVSLDEKTAAFEKAIQRIQASGRQIVTMYELLQHTQPELKASSFV